MYTDWVSQSSFFVSFSFTLSHVTTHCTCTQNLEVQCVYCPPIHPHLLKPPPSAPLPSVRSYSLGLVDHHSTTTTGQRPSFCRRRGPLRQRARHRAAWTDARHRLAAHAGRRRWYQDRHVVGSTVPRRAGLQPHDCTAGRSGQLGDALTRQRECARRGAARFASHLPEQGQYR